MMNLKFRKRIKVLHLFLVILLLIINKASQQQQQLAQLQFNSSANTSPAIKQPDYLETGRQITGILDRFMSLGYDKRVRPNYGGPPVEVNVTMRILSISSVSEVMMDFTADFYFRQTWHDPRLSFKKLGHIQTLYVGAEVSKKIWLPDTFFGNEKLAYFHEATTPNVFLRIDHSGEVYRSIRLTVTSSCPMNLQYFPMDRQRCTIEAESYGYNVKDIIYRWARKDTAVERDKEISLPQFDIVKTVQKYRLEELSSGTYSRLIAEIHFARRMGYYLIQIYIPSSLIVVISWVSFWLHRNASPARVQLGVTTVLTMTTLMSSTNAALPKISYVKSIDIFLGTCFIMVFAALLEYATVGYLGKRIAMRKAHMQHAQSQAQAKIFAQLQAQGAQGDPVPPTTTSSLLGSLAAAAATNNNNNNNYHLQQSPLLGQVAQQAALLQQQQQLGAPEVPERSHRCNHQSSSLAFLQQQQHIHNNNHISELVGGAPSCQQAGKANNNNNNNNNNIDLDNEACCCGNGACQNSSKFLLLQQQQQKQQQKQQKQQQQQQQMLADVLEQHSNCHCQHYKQHQASSSSSTLPRNFASLNQALATGSQCNKQNGNVAPCAHSNINNNNLNTNYLASLMSPTGILLNTGDSIALEKSMHEATGVNLNGFSNLNGSPGSHFASLPPAYQLQMQMQMQMQQQQNNLLNAATCGGGSGGGGPSGGGGSKGTSAAAAAAAATFVNLHRKQKGLPPSTNPNFSQFAWIGQHNKSMETIFGIRPSDIDKYSRVVFPVCFVCFQLMYWIVYLHISAFLESEQQQQNQQTN